MNSQKGKDFVVCKELLKRNESSKSKERITNIYKEPLRKSGTHSGLKFNFNLKKDVTSKAFSFEEKGNVSIVRKQIVASQNKEGCTDSGDRIKSSRIKFPVNNTQTVENIEHSTVLTEKEETELCTNVAESLKVLQPPPRTSKIGKPQTPIALKHEAVSSNTSKLPTFNVTDDVKVSKGQSTVRKETGKSATGRNIEEPLRKSGTHSGLKFNFSLKKDAALKAINIEEKDNVSIARKQIDKNQNKEGRTDSEDRIISSKVKVPVINTHTVEGVEHSTSLTKKEKTELNSNVAKTLKVLQSSPQTSMVFKSEASITLTPKAVSSNATKLPTFKGREFMKVSKDQSTERKEVCKSASGRSTEVTHKKFGSHSGLKFKLSVNKSSFTSVEQYGFTSVVSKSNSSKGEMNPQQTKEPTPLRRGSFRK